MFWPDLDNTFRAFEYTEAGIVKPAPSLSVALKEKAENTIKLLGLDKRPNRPDASDRRWQNRMETWNIAIESRNDLAEVDKPSMRRQITRTAKGQGYWSIWMTIFADDSDMLRRFIKAYTGTAKDCFDQNGQPVPRPGGQI